MPGNCAFLEAVCRAEMPPKPTYLRVDRAGGGEDIKEWLGGYKRTHVGSFMSAAMSGIPPAPPPAPPILSISCCKPPFCIIWFAMFIMAGFCIIEAMSGMPPPPPPIPAIIEARSGIPPAPRETGAEDSSSSASAGTRERAVDNDDFMVAFCERMDAEEDPRIDGRGRDEKGAR